MASALRDIAGRVQPVSLAGDQLLPVLPALEGLFPWGGLRRGSTVTVAASTSLVLALLAGPSRAGSWCSVVGMPSLGLAAAGEAGVVLDRLALVPEPGQDWPTVVAALLDAFDVVVVRPPGRVRIRDTRRLGARARERSAVLVPVVAWEGADVRLTVGPGSWEGIGEGHGHLEARRVEVRAEGRGAAARPRTARLWLPSSAGAVVLRPAGAPSKSRASRSEAEARPGTPASSPGGDPSPAGAVVAGLGLTAAAQ